MLKQLVTKVIGTRFERELKRIQPIIDRIHEHEALLGAMPESSIREQTAKFRARLHQRLGDIESRLEQQRAAKHACADPVEREGLDREVRELENKLRLETAKMLDELLPEAFATVREACRRLAGTKVVVTGHELPWDMVPYDVQLIGGIVLHQGKIAEMATGEGKTLVATLPLYLNALPGKGVHLVTVNNYLARRDSQWMGHLLRYLGLTVACIDDTEPSSPERRTAYASDVIYGTNNEFGFDYLRDNMVFGLEQRVQRSHVFAIIDEVDSILIDEARTPLIISGPVGTESDRKYADYNAQVQSLVRRQTAIVNDLIAQAESMLTDEKTRYDAAVKLHQAEKGIPKNKKLMKLLQDSETKQLVQRVELDYIAERKLPTRQQELPSLEAELFFVMDERGRSVHLTDKGVEAMSPGDPTLFVMPDISEEIGQLEKDMSLPPEEKLARRNAIESEYAVKSEKLHIIHKLLQAHALYEKDVEYVVQEGQVFIVDEFTGRIMAGRRWSDGLHQAIEAKENVVVQGETQTLATITIQNYFRMFEKLAGMTGTAETEETEFYQIYGLEVMVIPTNRPVRRVDKHDLIYKTRREKYNAVVEEAAREHGRGLPVLIGTVSVEVSETLSRLLKRAGLKHEVLNAKQHQREAEIVTGAGRAGAITIATNMAGRGTDIKLGPGVRQCQVCGITAKLAPFGQQREKPDLTAAQMVEKHCNENPPCGLVIIGTERHESRRIDRQLRGRSGRQGDPGQSVFFLSLEDDLMRLFGSDRIAKWMGDDASGESEVIQHPWVTRAIEGAQKRVELQNFQARKRLLDYDDVMNQQREVVYDLRLFALEGGEELKASAIKMIEAATQRRVAQGTPGDPGEWDRKLVATELMQQFLISAPAIENVNTTPDQASLATAARAAGRETFQRKLATLGDVGRKYGIEQLPEQMLARVMLQVLDEKWKDHLYDLDQLRDAIHYRQWGQKDPLIEYKREAFDMFRDLMQDIQATFTERFLKVQIQVNQGPGPTPAPPPGRPTRPAPSDRDLMVSGAAPSPSGERSPQPPRQAAVAAGPSRAAVLPGGPVPRVGRNDPCPCGSGKKYKKCHGIGT